MRKARKSVLVPLSLKLPPKKVREKFLIIYEMNGCKKAFNFLTQYYSVRKLQVILDGRKVGKKCVACYYNNRAYFKKEGFKKRTALYEFYHHLVEYNSLDLPIKLEEKEANAYARRFLQ